MTEQTKQIHDLLVGRETGNLNVTVVPQRDNVILQITSTNKDADIEENGIVSSARATLSKAANELDAPYSQTVTSSKSDDGSLQWIVQRQVYQKALELAEPNNTAQVDTISSTDQSVTR